MTPFAFGQHVKKALDPVTPTPSSTNSYTSPGSMSITSAQGLRDHISQTRDQLSQKYRAIVSGIGNSTPQQARPAGTPPPPAAQRTQVMRGVLGQ